jgi:hypothetical protein
LKNINSEILREINVGFWLAPEFRGVFFEGYDQMDKFLPYNTLEIEYNTKLLKDYDIDEIVAIIADELTRIKYELTSK